MSMPSIDCGQLTVRWANLPDGRVAANCDQMPGFEIALERSEAFLVEVKKRLAEHITRNFGLTVMIREQSNVAHFRLFSDS